MTWVTIIICVAFTLVAACFAFITAHSMWMTHRVLMGMLQPIILPPPFPPEGDQ